MFLVDENRPRRRGGGICAGHRREIPWTYRHSERCCGVDREHGHEAGFLAEVEIRELRRAALLHDLGKLSVSSLILDKPDKLTDTGAFDHSANTRRTRDRFSTASAASATFPIWQPLTSRTRWTGRRLPPRSKR